MPDIQHMLVISAPEGVSPMRALEAVVEDADGDDSGMTRVEGRMVSWNLLTTGDRVELDPRQRLAAALLLTAFDLPQEMGAAMRNMLEAAAINPGMTTDQIGGGRHDRIAILRRVHELVGAMIDEAAGGNADG